MFERRLADRFEEPRRPRRFTRNQPVEIEVADENNRLYWVPGKVIRRLRKNEDLPFRTSPWAPVESWYLVELDSNGSQGWATKSGLRLPGGASYYGS